MREGCAARISGVELVTSGLPGVEDAHVHGRVSALNTNGVCRTAGVSGHINKLQADIRIGDHSDSAGRKDEALIQRNGWAGWSVFVTGCRCQETTDK